MHETIKVMFVKTKFQNVQDLGSLINAGLILYKDF